jgi:hypothetical protein
MPVEPKLKMMVASTVHYFEDQLNQICAVLTGFGYEVWNSHIGTIPVHPGRSNLENCVAAARDCDVFLGIVRPFYGSGRIGDRSITHEEFLEAVRLRKPRWFLVHRAQEFYRLPEALCYVDSQFKDAKRIRRICEEMNVP